jgi:ATP-dependent exoDNAse (exonuclease V) beta subunit
VGREVPLLGLDTNCSVVSGAVDVLVTNAQGYWVVDYKSDRTDDQDARFQIYLPQLLAYAEALRKNESTPPVCGVAVFWITSGEITRMPLHWK